jgi:hypothetical protein
MTSKWMKWCHFKIHVTEVLYGFTKLLCRSHKTGVWIAAPAILTHKLATEVILSHDSFLESWLTVPINSWFGFLSIELEASGFQDLGCWPEG